MNSRETVVCLRWLTVVVAFVCLELYVCEKSNDFDIQCPWPAFNCQVKNNVQSLALSGELTGSRGLLHGCSNLQWTCRNGQCILASMRCNGRSDCVDESDEADCQGVGRIQDSTGLQRIQSRPVMIDRRTVSHNCTAMVSPAHDKFCRRRYRGYYGHPFDCEKYIVCEWGIYFECHCPPLTRWDIRIMACIWKYMSPCLSRDFRTIATSTPLHPSQIARLIDLLTNPQSELNRRKQLEQFVQLYFSTPRMREVNQIVPGSDGVPVKDKQIKIDSAQSQYNGNGVGSTVQ